MLELSTKATPAGQVPNRVVSLQSLDGDTNNRAAPHRGGAFFSEGAKFGRLTVLRQTNKRRSGHIVWLCQCECGETAARRLRSGGTQSCGCLRKDNSLRHGHARANRKSPTYISWVSMRQRCLNPNQPRYPDYGGRGIEICERMGPV
jgi:hypothetical protein